METHSKSVWSLSSVTGLNEIVFLFMPITHAVSGALADTRPGNGMEQCEKINMRALYFPKH